MSLRSARHGPSPGPETEGQERLLALLEIGRCVSRLCLRNCKREVKEKRGHTRSSQSPLDKPHRGEGGTRITCFREWLVQHRMSSPSKTVPETVD